MDSIFQRGNKGAVTIEDAAAASQGEPALEPAAANERYFGESEDVQKQVESAPPPHTVVQTTVPPEVTETLKALKQNADRQQAEMKKLQEGANAQAQMAQMANWEMARKQQAEYVKQFDPPTVEDVDDLITDGDKIKKFVEASRDHALKVADAKYAPMMQRMEALESIAEPVLYQARDAAWAKAEARLKKKGFTSEQMPQLRQLAESVAASSAANNWQQQQKYMLNPDAMAVAAEVSWEQSGAAMPVANAQAPPPPAAGGTPVSRGSESGAKPSVVAEVERRLGVKFGKESLQQFDQFRKENH